jgi:hypothetical protein
MVGNTPPTGSLSYVGEPFISNPENGLDMPLWAPRGTQLVIPFHTAKLSRDQVRSLGLILEGICAARRGLTLILDSLQ